jgi:putative ABC transport system permease protein
LLALQMAEYGLLAGLLALVALGLGSGLGWLVVVKLFSFEFLPDWPRVLAVLGGGLAVVLGFALAARCRCCAQGPQGPCASCKPI